MITKLGYTLYDVGLSAATVGGLYGAGRRLYREKDSKEESHLTSAAKGYGTGVLGGAIGLPLGMQAAALADRVSKGGVHRALINYPNSTLLPLLAGSTLAGAYAGSKILEKLRNPKDSQ